MCVLLVLVAGRLDSNLWPAQAPSDNRSAPSAAQSTFGVWVLDVSKSKLPDDVVAAVKIEEPSDANGMRDTIEYRLADGRTRLSINPFVGLDGKEHPLDQVTIVTHCNGKQEIIHYTGITFILERDDGRRTGSVIKKDGKQASSNERSLSEDGMTLTVIRKYVDNRPDAVLVWQRRGNGPPIASRKASRIRP
jgi:hypothetical protein